MIHKQYTAATITRAPGGNGRRRTFIISTGSPDRDHDVVEAAGWRLENYRKNPVVLWAHDYRALPLGKCVDIRADGTRLVATAEFADHDMANTVLRLIDGGFLRATSVGFRPITSVRNDAGGLDFLQQELLEFSVVPVPANPEALVQLRAKGLLPGSATGDDETVVLLTDDDETITYEQVAAAMPGAMAGLRGDLEARRRHAERNEQVDVSASDVAEAVRVVVRSALAEVVRDAVGDAVRRRLGRVD